MKKIAAVLTAFSMFFSGLLINVAADGVYDPFGTAAFGPSAPETESNYRRLGKAKALAIHRLIGAQQSDSISFSHKQSQEGRFQGGEPRVPLLGTPLRPFLV